MAENSEHAQVNDKTVKLLLEGLLQPADAGDEAVGDTVGDFCLVERLGEGGFGIVWRAVQTVPVKREVALKLLKLGMDSREVLARFEQERQILATMEHPCIAGMLGAGMTGDGRPFFVMELVRGLTLTRYAVEKKLPLCSRLGLFIDLCRGVQHAHQKGVIHRDLKPSNVLVTEVDGQPVPKIIDFGIAKALTPQRDAAMSLLTRTGTVMGTPLYMAPEQLTDRDLVDTRSDVYALGALLYELLTDEPPFPAKTFTAKGEDEMRRIIRVVVPQRPSRRNAQMLGEKIATDLDWITLRALEKDPRRRYASAAELATDVERFLTDQPVLAHPPEWRYLTMLWVRRHRAACAAILISAAALISGTTIALWQAQEARRERNVALEHETAARLSEARATTSEILALKQKQRAEQMALFLGQLLDHAAAEVEKGRNPEALAGALGRSRKLLQDVTHDAVLQGDLLKRISGLCVSIGDWQGAIAALTDLAAVTGQVHGPESEEAHEAILDYLKREADHGTRGAVPEKLVALKARIEQAGRKGSKLWFDVQRELVRVWIKLDDGPKALEVSQRMMAAVEEHDLRKQGRLNVRVTHAYALEFAGRYDEALALLEITRLAGIEEKASQSAMLAIERRQLLILQARGDNAGGAVLLRRRVEAMRAAHPPPKPDDMISTLLQLAGFESTAGQHDESLLHAGEALELARDPAAEGAALCRCLVRLAEYESAAGRHDTAVVHAQEACAEALRLGRRRELVSAQEQLAWSLREAGRAEESYAVWEENCRVHEDDPNFKSVFYPLAEMAAIRHEQKRHAEAVEIIRDIWRRCVSHPQGAKDIGELGYTAQLGLKYQAAQRQAAPGTPPPAELAAWQKAAETYIAQKEGKGRAPADKGPAKPQRVGNAVP